MTLSSKSFFDAEKYLALSPVALNRDEDGALQCKADVGFDGR